MEINISKFTYKKTLLKYDDERYLIVFVSKKIFKLVFNYPVYKKELMIIIETFNK